MIEKEEDKETKSEFSDRFRKLRRQKNLSQADLGKIVNIHYTHIGRYERGLSKPNSETAKRLANALGVTTDYLLEGNTDEAAKANLEDRELLQMFKEVEKFSTDDKIFVKRILDAILTKKKVQNLAR